MYTTGADADSPAEPALPGFSPNQARTLLDTFTNFLIITVHTVLYHRGLYPPETFLLARQHNLPVPQSRHPGLCTWITDSVSHIKTLLSAGSLSKIYINLHLPKSLQVAERWVFDVSLFPKWAQEEKPPPVSGQADTERRDNNVRPAVAVEEESGEASLDAHVNWADVDQAIRGVLRRIAYAGEVKGPLPRGSTFTLAVEVKDDAPAPIGHPQPWIPASGASPVPPAQVDPAPIPAIEGRSTTPLRTVQAGPLFFECWVEEGGPPVS